MAPVFWLLWLNAALNVISNWNPKLLKVTAASQQSGPFLEQLWLYPFFFFSFSSRCSNSLNHSTADGYLRFWCLAAQKNVCWRGYMQCSWASNMLILLDCVYTLVHLISFKLLNCYFVVPYSFSRTDYTFTRIGCKKILCTHVILSWFVCVFTCSTTQRIQASSVQRGSGTCWRHTALSLTHTNWKFYWPSPMATLMEKSATRTLWTWWDLLTFHRISAPLSPYTVHIHHVFYLVCWNSC